MKGPRFKLAAANCLDALRELPDNYVHAIVTDPPYGLTSSKGKKRKKAAKGFMGQKWDGRVPGKKYWRECLRVARPGAFLVAFGGGRTFHRLACAIEDAGWELRDNIHHMHGDCPWLFSWVRGGGFAKGHDVAKDFDRQAGAQREVVGTSSQPNNKRSGYTGVRYKEKRKTKFGTVQDQPDKTAPVTAEAKQWDGWNVALKPLVEPIILARKPLEGTIAANVRKWGTGVMNIRGCRIPSGKDYADKCASVVGCRSNMNGADYGEFKDERTNSYQPEGRWPGNVILDEDAAATMDSSGASSRFFYVARAGRREKELGLDNFKGQRVNDGRKTSIDNPYQRGDTIRKNRHPTVKPVALMRYLVRLVSPPDAIVLDPFMGSGSTGIACMLESKHFLGIDRKRQYVRIASARIRHARAHPKDYEPKKRKAPKPATKGLWESTRKNKRHGKKHRRKRS